MPMLRRSDISAAGAVVLKPDATGGPDAVRVLVVHRPAYDDWSLPKGKVEPGEVPAVAAVREVLEETGVRIRLTAPLDAHTYRVGRRTKQVRWWRAAVVAEEPHVPDDEVDTVLWLTPAEALELFSYDADATLLQQALDQPETVNLVVVRHGKAMDRGKWSGNDPARPLTRRGRTQARELVPILEAFGVGRVVSSSANRCVSTVLPFVTDHQLTIDRQTILSEERGVEDPAAVGDLIGVLRDEVIGGGRAVVVCSHRPVLPAILTALDLPDHPFHTAECAIVSLTADDQVHAVQWITTPHKK
ncbi:NUDIX hydrolase [Enemella evansiae]|uniref:NUDIX hydrolase n=1 Tax=Enemella evansiae TaxID=2016499 RepID=UPI001556C3D2|nr:NUDIX hydrolase [Enemella evansiae]